jgi:valyl-tRNA synthetase
VEPYLSPQWFVKIAPLAKPAIEAVEKGDTVFVPETWKNTYMSWMNNILDWCISRQLWWGHQIPAWYCPDGHVTVTREDPTACGTCGKTELRRDPDVLDTWFSSALWPFSTLGWPDRTKALETFYPTTVMETGFDIIFFWVARMMMMGLHFMGDVPFKTVYLHAMVRDEKGEKMSKTKGNVIDPLVVTEKYGADALRFTLASMAAQGRDIKLSLDRVSGYKAFANKIWNAARFALLHVKDLDMTRPLDESQLTDADRWIVARYHRAVADVTRALESFRLNDACSRLYRFLWHEFCDWYIELVKPRLYDGTPDEKAASARVLRDVLEGSLRLLHPVMPFVTEEIWQRLPRAEGDPESVMIAPYPVAEARWVEDRDADRFDLLIELIEAIRSLRVDVGVPEAAEVEVHFATEDGATGRWLEERASWMKRLAKVKALLPKERGWPSTPGVLVRGVEIRLALAGVVDVAELVKKLEKDEAKLAGDLAKVEGRLANPGFVAKAPPEVVEKDRGLAGELAAKLAKVRENLERVRTPAPAPAAASAEEQRAEGSTGTEASSPVAEPAKESPAAGTTATGSSPGAQEGPRSRAAGAPESPAAAEARAVAAAVAKGARAKARSAKPAREAYGVKAKEGPKPVAEAGVPEASGVGTPALAPSNGAAGLAAALSGLREKIAAAVADALTRSRLLEGIERLGEGRVEDALRAFVHAARGPKALEAEVAEEAPVRRRAAGKAGPSARAGKGEARGKPSGATGRAGRKSAGDSAAPKGGTAGRSAPTPRAAGKAVAGAGATKGAGAKKAGAKTASAPKAAATSKRTGSKAAPTAKRTSAPKAAPTAKRTAASKAAPTAKRPSAPKAAASRTAKAAPAKKPAARATSPRAGKTPARTPVTRSTAARTGGKTSRTPPARRGSTGKTKGR